jgi:putative transposase
MWASHTIRPMLGRRSNCVRRRPSVRAKHLIRDNDDKYGVHFAAVAAGAHIDIITTPIEVPRANGICERFVGSVRRECLDHLLVFGEGHLRRIMSAYVEYFNTLRPHQGLAQRIPIPPPVTSSRVCGSSLARS